ncbi:MAG: TIGR03643 family protein [Bacteroidetes bacterium]|nr:TIGR03643 family protein [Bacteroidota bacterium]
MPNPSQLEPRHLVEDETSEIIEMALSDHTSFAQIEALYGLKEKEVKALMRSNLKKGSYQAWRKRVRKFSDRRENYK